MKISKGNYVTQKGTHVTITTTSATKAYGRLSGEKKYEEWTIEGIHTDPQKTIVRKA
jgi:preprotein translocase subunit Sec63